LNLGCGYNLGRNNCILTVGVSYVLDGIVELPEDLVLIDLELREDCRGD
jgi:hypothetical protein